MNISKALLQTRKATGKRQTETAQRIGLSQTYLSQIETGSRVPSMEVIEMLCKEYNTPLAVMMWRAVEEKDIDKRKLVHYRNVKATMDSLIDSIFI